MLYPRNSIPEPPLEPPDDEFCVTAGCGHEVYDGEELVVDNDSGKTQCTQCFLDEICELPLPELAERFNSTLRVVTREER